MAVEPSETGVCHEASLVTIHGFRVQSYGKPVSSGFKRALRRLAERGFADPDCVVVKTLNAPRSGITHAGGRYVPPDSGYRHEVIRQMRELGMESPWPPFLIAPGETTLYHEWGHHVDYVWSIHDPQPRFSFRWFSRFYQLVVRTTCVVRPVRSRAVDGDDARPIESDKEAADAAIVWWKASSELFADLFEDWMRGDKKVSWDECEPESMQRRVGPDNLTTELALLPEVSVENVRAETYDLLASGIRFSVEQPQVRPGLLGENTDEMIGRFHSAMEMVGAGGVRPNSGPP